MTSGGDGSGLKRDHFVNLVKDWSHFGAPLRPSPEDTAVVKRVIDSLRPAPRAVVLGLTPETIQCNWPRGTDLLAIDHSAAMIRSLWKPENSPPGSRAILGNWREMPIPMGTIDVVTGDGCFSMIPYPEGFDDVTREARRVLRPSGRFIMRVFIRPDIPETLEKISTDLQEGNIGSVHALKLRLIAAVHPSSGAGARLGDAWDAWTTLPELPAAQRGARGWTVDELTGLENYKGLDTRYFFPTAAELRAGTASLFDELECFHGSYELADRCPTFVFAPRSATSDRAE